MLAGFILPKVIHSIKIQRSILVVILLQSLGLFFISTKSAWLVVPFSYFLIVSHLMWNYIDADIIHKHIPSQIRATVMSGRQLMISFVYLFNPWLMAYLVQTFRWKVFFYFGIIVLVAGLIIAFLGRRHFKNNK